MRLKNTDFNEIRSVLPEAMQKADNIRSILKRPNLSLMDKTFFDRILKNLDDLKFNVIYTNKIEKIEGYGHLSSFVIFNHQFDRSRGGRIYIYDKYSIKKKRELLMHEFVHIHDGLSPWSTDITDENNGYMLTALMLKAVETRTEIISLELMMPAGELRDNLYNTSYDIEKIVEIYNGIEAASVLKWIMLHDDFYAHYAIIYFIKNEGAEIKYKIDEYRRDNITFDILNILSNENSIAYKSRLKKALDKGTSTIDNKKYECFCFYDKEIVQPLPLDIIAPYEVAIICDKMVVIGWPKEIYDIIAVTKIPISQ